MVNTKRGATYPAKQGVNEGILSFAKEALSKECFDAVLMTAKMQKCDSFAHMLIADETLLGDAYPLCPVMPIQGARVISSLTGHGKGKKKIGVLVRPCEARATIELAKLGQVDLENITIITMDCPGVIPLSDYFEDAGKGDKVFEDAFQNWNSGPMRPVCRICDKFSSAGAEDLHIGIMGAKGGGILLIPHSPKGEDVLNKMGLSLEEDITDWEASVNKLTEERKQKRNQINEGLRSDIEGIDRLLESFSACINCHNCMRVCPICYCRQCHFDSDNMKFSFDDYLTRAEARGGLTIPTDTLLFHIGRMLHMSLSCVSCGMCEDACPMAIPVAQVFTLVGDRNQEAFDYIPGRSVDEPLPLKTFKEEEFLEVEQSYTGVSARQENQND